MSDREPLDYRVGFGKPPRHTQFKKGRSGNLKGRPKKKPTPRDILDRALRKQVTVTENGVRKRLTMYQVIMKQLVIKAMSGDQEFIKLLLTLGQRTSTAERGQILNIIPVKTGSRRATQATGER